VTADSRPDGPGDHGTARSSWAPTGPVVGVVVAGLTVFLAITITAGLLIWDDVPVSTPGPDGRRIAGTGVATTAAVPSAQLEQNTRTARVGTASLVLPDDPYIVHPEPLTADGLFDSFFWAAATVHPRYDARGRNWSSTMLLGRLSSGPWTGDLEQDGRRVLEAMSRSFFDGHHTEVRELSGADHAVDGHPGMLFTATVHYSVPRLASRYDTVTALLLRLEDGSVVVAASSVPNDTDPMIARQAADALRTLSIR
jgi:hypothetical protein